MEGAAQGFSREPPPTSTLRNPRAASEAVAVPWCLSPGWVSSFQFQLGLSGRERLRGLSSRPRCDRARRMGHFFPDSARVLLLPGSPWGQAEAGPRVCLVGTWPQRCAIFPEVLSWPQDALVLNADGSRSCCRKFVITKGNIAQMYHAPGRKREFNAFVLDKTYFGPYDETTCIDWTDDSR